MEPVKVRRESVLALRAQGMLFREIGIRMGISSARAAQLYHAGVKDRAKPIPIESFTIDTPVERLPIGPRARAALARHAVPLAELIHRDRDGLARELLQLPSCNRHAWNEIERILISLQRDTGDPDGRRGDIHPALHP
ncbi:MAG: hypothetical protein JWR80_2766 [Bradyrhizobium sp.]|nr:hypothetical protein [Bradyrhizobium sp.]